MYWQDLAPDPDTVTPGLYGFLVIFVLALATWLLMRNMTSRLRRMSYREAALAAQQAEPAPEDEPGTPDEPGSGQGAQQP